MRLPTRMLGGRAAAMRADRWLIGVGAVIALAAVAPPVDAVAHDHLPWHMAQHSVLVSLAAPLLGAGFASRRRAPEPFAAAAAVTVALWFWHAPVFFDAAVRSDFLHMCDHACLLATAAAFWWAVAAMITRPRLGAGALAVAGAAIANTLLGATLTLWPRLLYTTGSPNLADQQMAGVVMWAGGGAAFVVALTVLCSRWLAQDGDP